MSHKAQHVYIYITSDSRECGVNSLSHQTLYDLSSIVLNIIIVHDVIELVQVQVNGYKKVPPPLVPAAIF